MKILMLTPYLPYPLLSGGQIRTYNLLKKLAAHHEVTLFALIKDDSELAFIKELQPFCSQIRVFRRSRQAFTLRNIFHTALSKYPFLVIRNFVPSLIKVVEEELASTKYDLIHAETFYMMPHIPKTKVPIILVEQTIEYLGYESYAKRISRFLRPLLNIDIRKIHFWERFFWQRCRVLIVMSDEDRQLIASEGIDRGKIRVVPNGVNVEWFQEKPRQEPARPTVLFVGTFKWLPNQEAVQFLVREIWPSLKQMVPGVQLHIVGFDPPASIQSLAVSDSDISVRGDIVDIRDAFRQAQVLVAPVLSGKGTRYKVLEAMAAGTAVIATSTAVEGLGVHDGREVLIANTPHALAQATANALLDKKLRANLASAAATFVARNYDWPLISHKLDTIYRSIRA